MQPIEIPLWLVLVGGALAVWAVFARILAPSVRWFFRRRVNRFINRINERLDLRLPPFTLTRRRSLIDRLMYDPQVIYQVDLFCKENDVPRDVVMAKIEHYAKEIVPAFRPYIYFRLATWMARRILRTLYRVRMGHGDQPALKALGHDVSTVFVMNHRSNMDYVLVAHLTRSRAALSFAAGEWARVWPIQQLVKALGAYFVRRNSGNPLYRKVLERYVQMAVEGGVVQAVFPEGGLSRDGCLRKPRIGLLDYMLRTFRPDGGRDIVFVPVAVNYDRVLEDRTLLLNTDPDAERRSGRRAVTKFFAFLARNIWLGLRGRWFRFGYAGANYGAPISLRQYLAEHDWNPHGLERDTRIERVKELADDLMTAIGNVVPVLPVSLVATVFARDRDAMLSKAELGARVEKLRAQLKKRDASLYTPRENTEYTTEVGLRMLTLRNLLVDIGGKYGAKDSELKVINYYANSIRHLLPGGE